MARSSYARRDPLAPESMRNFHERFYWVPNSNHFPVFGTKCLENVLLTLYIHGRISLEHFNFLHDIDMSEMVWEIVQSLPALDVIPVLGDIALRSPTREHAMIFVRSYDTDDNGWVNRYVYLEYYREDGYFREKLSWWKNRDCFVSAIVVAEALVSIISQRQPRSNLPVRVQCEVIADYRGDDEEDMEKQEPERGYLLLPPRWTSTVWRISFIYPSRPGNYFFSGYCYCVRNLSENAETGWVPQEVLHPVY